MEIWDIDTQVMAYMQKGEYDNAERFLITQHLQLRAGEKSTALRHILNELAMFYRLPYKRNFTQSEVYYREMETVFPDWETDLRLANFYFYSLRDFSRVVAQVDAMSGRKDQNKESLQFYYSALTLKGVALLYLNRNQESVMVLRELEWLISSSPSQIPYGDELNFLNELAKRKLESTLCRKLATVIVSKVRDQEFKDKFMALLETLQQGNTIR